MNRRSFLQTAGAATVAALIPKALVPKAAAQSVDAPDLSPLTLALCALPDGDWTIYGGVTILERLFSEMDEHPEQIPARDGTLSFFFDFYPWRLDERRQLIHPFRVTKMGDVRMSSPNPDWTEAKYERVFAVKKGDSHTFLEFLVGRKTLDVEAYRIPKIV